MKKRTLSLMTAAGLMAALGAGAAPESDSYPVLRPENCSENIVIPAGSNAQLYMSKDCKTAYVLPKDEANMKVTGLAMGPGVRESDCGRALNIDVKEKAIEEQITLLQSEMNAFRSLERRKLEAAAPEQAEAIKIAFNETIAQIEATIKEYKEELKILNQRLPFSKWEGASVNLHLSLGLHSDVNAFQAANQDAGILFKAAPINHGILSFALAKDAGELEYRNVLGARFPGLSSAGDDVFEDSAHLVANGGMSGLMVLSQPSVCAMIENLRKKEDGTQAPFDRNVLKADKLVAGGFAANYTYEIPVATDLKFEFHGKSEPKDILASWKSKTTKGEFTQYEVSELLLTGELKNGLHVKYSDGGQPFEVMSGNFEDDPRLQSGSSHVFSYLLGHALDLYLEMIIEKMKAMKLMQDSIKTQLTPISGKETFRPRVVRDCKWKTKWGRRPKRKCSNRTVQDRYFVDGITISDKEAKDHSSIAFDWVVDAQHTLTMKHTTGFVQQIAVKE